MKKIIIYIILFIVGFIIGTLVNRLPIVRYDLNNNFKIDVGDIVKLVNYHTKK